MPAVRVLATDYPKGNLIPPHRHDWAQLIYARAGVMTVSTAAGAWVVPPQRAVWMPALLEHAIRCATRLSMRTIYIDAGARHGLPAACGVVSVTPLLRELVLASVEAPGGGPRRELLVGLLLEEIRAAPLAPLHLPEPLDPRLKRITAALGADPGDPRTLAAWGKVVGASVRTLSRRFLAETGMTFRQWQRQARLLAALVRLAQREPVTSGGARSRLRQPERLHPRLPPGAGHHAWPLFRPRRRLTSSGWRPKGLKPRDHLVGEQVAGPVGDDRLAVELDPLAHEIRIATADFRPGYDLDRRAHRDRCRAIRPRSAGMDQGNLHARVGPGAASLRDPDDHRQPGHRRRQICRLEEVVRYRRRAAWQHACGDLRPAGCGRTRNRGRGLSGRHGRSGSGAPRRA